MVMGSQPHSHAPQVTKLQELFPSANVTKMVSRTPGIMYLDVDRTVRSKAMWIQQAVGLDQEGLDRLVEQGMNMVVSLVSATVLVRPGVKPGVYLVVASDFNALLALQSPWYIPKARSCIYIVCSPIRTAKVV